MTSGTPATNQWRPVVTGIGVKPIVIACKTSVSQAETHRQVVLVGQVAIICRASTTLENMMSSLRRGSLISTHLGTVLGRAPFWETMLPSSERFQLWRKVSWA